MGSGAAGGAGSFSVSSRLAAPVAEVWQHATTVSGINEELRPVLRMTAPADVRGLDPTTITLGKRICRSWLLLGGILPVEYDDLVVVELEAGRRFLERSTMLTQRVWQHERVLEPDGPAACVLTDRLIFQPRTRWLLPVVSRIVRSLFRHRHRRLRRRFGQAGDE
jgi:ligand-binding SRPBCC domain-containing protein